jgi:LPS sulfotransferase NodH
LSSYQRNPSDFLERSIFKKYPVKISAVGFKIFYYHAQDDSRKAVWEYLKNNEYLRVIHIKRKNILKTYLSRKRAEMTDDWANISGNKKDYPAVFLDYEECLRNFTSTRTWESQYDLFFDNHQKIDLYYENLARDYDREMNRVWELLGVDYEPVKPNTYKQATKPLSIAISNYFELKEKFIGTPWEEFFED